MAAYQFPVIGWRGLTIGLRARVDMTYRYNIWPPGFRSRILPTGNISSFLEPRSVHQSGGSPLLSVTLSR